MHVKRQSAVWHYNEACVSVCTCVCAAAGILYLTGKVDFSASPESLFGGKSVSRMWRFTFSSACEGLDERVFVLHIQVFKKLSPFLLFKPVDLVLSLRRVHVFTRLLHSCFAPWLTCSEKTHRFITAAASTQDVRRDVEHNVFLINGIHNTLFLGDFTSLF